MRHASTFLRQNHMVINSEFSSNCWLMLMQGGAPKTAWHSSSDTTIESRTNIPNETGIQAHMCQLWLAGPEKKTILTREWKEQWFKILLQQQILNTVGHKRLESELVKRLQITKFTIEWSVQLDIFEVSNLLSSLYSENFWSTFSRCPVIMHYKEFTQTSN